MSASPKNQGVLRVPQVKVNDHHGSLSSLPTLDKGRSPGVSPHQIRKILGLKKIMPWKRKNKGFLDVDQDSDDVREENVYDQTKKIKRSVDGRTKELEIRKKRSRSVDHILTDPGYTAIFEVSPQAGRHISAAEVESSLHSTGRSSVTDEESGDGESGTETYDAVDGIETTERLNEQSQRLRKKIEKTKERMRKLQCSMDVNLEEYFQSVKGNPDPELSKKAFEKKNLKSNAITGQLQKKLDKYHKAQNDLETRQQRAKSNTAKEVLRGVRTSVKEISGGVRDGVKAGFTGAVSKFFNSNENITDAHPLSKSDSECHDINSEEVDHHGGYDIGKPRAPSPRYSVCEEDSLSLTSANQSSSAASAPCRHLEPNVDPFEARLKEIQEAQVTLQETVDKALSNINAIATSLQEERYKTQRLECQFIELRGHWNDFSELHQNEIMVLRQEMERADERMEHADERIETVDYRIVERVAEIDESFDTFDARISKIENLHHQQGLTVDDYLEQNTQTKAILTKFLSVLLAILTLLFSLFTLLVHGIAPVTRTRIRLIATTILVAFLALWWHNPQHLLVVHFQRHIIEPFQKLILFLTKKLAR